MKTLGIIPARYHSTRLPGKPIALIAGKPMMIHVYERALNSGLLNELVIATDDDRIFSVAQQFNARTIMTSANHQSGTDRCAEALSKLNESYDAVINIQGDEPFISIEHLQSVHYLLQNEYVQIASLVKKISNENEIADPNVVKAVFDKNGKALYFSRSVIPFNRSATTANQIAYYKHIGLYGYSTTTLKKIAALSPTALERAESLEQLRWLENGYPIHLAITETESHSVDTHDDLLMANKLSGNV